MKDGMSGMLQEVRLGQVRKAIKSSIIRPHLLSISIFRNSEKNCQIRGHPGGVRWWKNWLRGLFKQVRLGQVRKAKKSWKSEALGPPNPFVDLFWTKIWKNGFWKNDLTRKCMGPAEPLLVGKRIINNLTNILSILSILIINFSYKNVFHRLSICITCICKNLKFVSSIQFFFLT